MPTSLLSDNFATDKNKLVIFQPVIDPPSLFRPFFEAVPAGFPSPAADYVERQLDLNEHFVARPAATFFVRVIGESMTGIGIYPNDILIVDRSLEAQHGNIVIAIVEGELTVKKLYHKNNVIMLEAENSNFNPIIIKNNMVLEIWGVVSGVTRKL
jgi:DNA polymerase V